MKNLRNISREALKSVKGGTKEGCPGPKSPFYHPYATQEQCENATGKTCSYSEESNCFPAGWNADLILN
ncbi:bacteriocin-like protein [Chryseobacterium sp. SIMBA_029]|uniref:bacteriocin-like protein n=1 Tax=Chryseobacterium sp. SIMBA_029 TaxID=3085772 RepID=UPI00397CF81B